MRKVGIGGAILLVVVLTISAPVLAAPSTDASGYAWLTDLYQDPDGE